MSDASGPVITVTTQNLSEFHAWARTFARGLNGRELLLLSGPMGAGKTEFVKTLAQELGAREAASSPTYAFHQQYKLASGASLEHWDLYRVKSEDELDSIAFWDLLASTTGIVCVEWPERVTDGAWPLDREVVRVRLTPDGARREIQVTLGA